MSPELVNLKPINGNNYLLTRLGGRDKRAVAVNDLEQNCRLKPGYIVAVIELDRSSRRYKIVRPTADSMTNIAVITKGGAPGFEVELSFDGIHDLWWPADADKPLVGTTVGSKANSFECLPGGAGFCVLSDGENDVLLNSAIGDSPEEKANIVRCVRMASGGAAISLVQIKSINSSAGTCKVTPIAMQPDSTPNYVSSDDSSVWTEVYYLRS